MIILTIGYNLVNRLGGRHEQIVVFSDLTMENLVLIAAGFMFQEGYMRGLVQFFQRGAIAMAILTVAACSAVSSRDTRQWTPTAVTDLKSVAGTWEGILVGVAGPRADEDWVRLTIGETGAYEFASYRTIGVFSGKGNLTLTDGRLTAQSDKGKMALQLFRDAADGERMLRAEAATSDGQKYSAQLTPSKKVAPAVK